MTNSENSEDLGSADSDDNMGKFNIQEFYSPLSVTGYLTPLQRKKLREKRNFQLADLCDSSPKEVKKSRSVKRKKEHGSAEHSKTKARVKKFKTKEIIPHVQCTVSKIILKKADSDIKNRKFFKSSSSDRLEKANFTMPLVLKKNVFLDIDKCVKDTLLHSKKLSHHKEISCDHSFLVSADTSEDLESDNVTKKNFHESISSSVQGCDSKIQRESHSSREKNENVEQKVPKDKRFIFEFDWPSDDELLKRQEKARENARKQNILKELKNLHNQKSVKSDLNVEANPVKLYPIFHIALKKQFKSNENIKRSPKLPNKKTKDFTGAGDQMIIDAGQKEIGAKVCKTCNMIYTVGQNEDERLHLNYHNMYLINLKFPGWKEENMIGEYCDGRVIMIRKNDKSFKLKKVEDILQVANRDLGFPSSAIPEKPDLTFLLFISKDKHVAGCVMAEPISKAFRVILGDNRPSSKDISRENVWRIGNWYSSSEAVPAVCGVNRIWVAHNYRRHKVASRMVDCLRCHFVYGHVIGIRELAFTDPSPDGQKFAAAYTGTKNFLVYR